MSEDDEFDLLMFLHKATRLELVSSDTARGLAMMVFRGYFGDAELNRRLPLEVVDGGDRWKITAPFIPTGDDIDPDPSVSTPGPFKMDVMKFDGQILGFGEKRNFRLIKK
jgi:hypothetical protein